jgi:GTP-binding protein Era
VFEAPLRPEDLDDQPIGAPLPLAQNLAHDTAVADSIERADDAAEESGDDDLDDDEPGWDDPPPPVAPQAHRAGFVALVGRPNVGKSTLLNRLLGQKLAITSHKPQTTRGRVLGILSRPEFQLALVDTPGLHDARGGINAHMVDAALHTLADADVAVFLIEAGSPAIDGPTKKALEQVRRANKPTILVINKVDEVVRSSLLPLIDRWKNEHAWTDVYPLSALTGDNVEGLPAALARHVPEGPAMFPPGVWTDVSERDLCGELIREQILRRTDQEVPYSAAVLIETFDESEREVGARGLVRIHATVLVERDSQKAIVIGKGGSMLKDIGSSARHGMEKLLGAKVFLELHVRVEKDWSSTDVGLRRAGYGPSGK